VRPKKSTPSKEFCAEPGASSGLGGVPILPTRPDIDRLRCGFRALRDELLIPNSDEGRILISTPHTLAKEITHFVRRLSSLSFVLLLPFACDGGSDVDSGGAGGRDVDSGVNLDLGQGGSGTPSGGATAVYQLPEGFTPGDKGGWLVGDEIVSGGPGSGGGSGTGGSNGTGGGDDEDCGTEIVGIVRDFRRGDLPGGHPDFAQFNGDGATTGLVMNELSAARKPQFSGDPRNQMTTADNFDQWYNNTPDVNRAYLTTFSFEPNDGVLTFQSNAFFPLDDKGWGNQDEEHNYGFTTEIHTQFVYNAGDTFAFTGDDDLWVFINDRLALDIGGLHSQVSDSISLDDLAGQLEIEVGKVYALDLFHAERAPSESNFRVDTTLQFTSCAIIVDDVVK